MNDETLAATPLAIERPTVTSGLALKSRQGPRCVPIFFADTRLGEDGDWFVEGSPLLVLGFRDGVLYSDPHSGLEVNGYATAPGTPLKVGDVVRLGSEGEWEVVPFTLPARLRCFSSPHIHQCWPIGAQARQTIGRRGKRRNDIELDHPTVSRAQASLECGPDGAALVAEAVCHVNGRRLESGERHTLVDSDLVRFGELVFRYHLEPVAGHAGLMLHCLGGFQASLGGNRLSSRDWQGSATRFLLAYLAEAWPGAVSVDKILGDFWPEVDDKRARGLLRTLLSRLRKVVEPGEGSAVIVRTATTVGISPDIALWHDVGKLREALKAGEPRSALELYRGPYLVDCYMEWANEIRTDLEATVIEAAMGQARSAADPAERRYFAGKALGLDGSHEEAAELAMRACREMGRPEEAVAIYEELRTRLQADLETEPGEAVECELRLSAPMWRP